MSDAKKSNPKKSEILDKVKDLPTLPQVLVGISKVANDPKAGADQLAGMILKDQSLTLRVLKIANSARYAMYANKITTVSKAVMIMGFQSVRTIALGSEMYRVLSNLTKAGDIHERFWRESISVAVTCQELAVLFNMAVVEEAFVAGLLHDVGKLILAQHNPALAAQVYSQNLEGLALLAEESRVFGINHVELGGELAKRWELPEEIRSAMERHHHNYNSPPTDKGDQMAFFVSASKTLLAPFKNDDDHRLRAANMARLLRKPVGLLMELLRRLPQEIEDYAGFFDIQVEDLKVYTLWVEDENKRLSDNMVERERARRSQERRDALLMSIREVHELIIAQSGLDVLARKMAQTARLVVGADRVLIGLFNDTGTDFDNEWHAGDVEQEFVGNMRRTITAGGMVSQVVREGQALNIIDLKMPYFRRALAPEELKAFDAESLAIIPIKFGRAVAGLFYCDRGSSDEPFGDEEIVALETLTNLITLALKS